MPRLRPTIALIGLFASLAAAGRQAAEDPAIRAAVERYFATQQAEDIEGYLALWSTTAQRPRPEQLKYVFDSGDDLFSDIAVLRVTPVRDGVRVRVSATRNRTERGTALGPAAITRRSQMLISLTFAREGGEWKLLREAPVIDDLASALIDAQTPDEREQILKEEDASLTVLLTSALSRRAAEAAQTQRFAAAQTGYERMLEVARRFGDRRAEGEALQSLGNAFYFQRNFEAALNAYTARLEVARARDDAEGIAAALGGIATVRYSYAEYGAALTSYREALAIQEQLHDEQGAATTLISTGNVLYLQGDYEAAVRDYQRSRDLYHKLANAAGEAGALEGLGRVLLAQGDLTSALQAFSGMLADARTRSDHGKQGTALTSIGDVHFRLGNLEAARGAFEESRKQFDVVKDLSNVGRVWQNVALTDLVAGSFANSEREYGQSTASCTAAADEECVAAATVGLAFAQTAQEKYLDGIASYRRGIEQFTRLRRPEPTARAQIGLSLALSGGERYTEAIEAASIAKRTAVGLSNDDVLWRALVAEARALRRSGARDQALGVARAAIYPVDRLEEAATTRPGNTVPGDSSEAFAALAVLQAESGDAAAAFDTAERLHVHDLRAALRPHEREIARGMSTAERDDERALAVELVSLHAQLARERNLPKPDAARMQTLETRVAETAARRTGQQQRLFDRLPDLRLWRGLMPSAVSQDLTGLLDTADTLLLEFVVSQDSVLLIAAWRDETSIDVRSQVINLTRKAIANRVADLVRPAVLADSAEWKRAAVVFSRDLLSPAFLPRIESAKRIVVVPHDILWRVPFEALLVGDRYLGDGRMVSYAPSVTALLRTPAARTSQDRRVLAVAAPAIPATIRDRVAETTPGWTLRRPEPAEQEAQAVTDDVNNATLLLGAAATEAALREKLPQAGVIHLAAPFRVNHASPLFSPVLLARADPDLPPTPADDGALELRDVMNLEATARVAVLSDGGAFAMWDSAEDAGTVFWAWRAAGVPAVVMRRWSADDTSAEISKELCHRLRDDTPPDQALQAAVAKVRTAAERSAPLYWAGWFVLMGR